MVETGSHTLNRVAEAMGSRFDENVLHTAMLLAYVQALYGVIRKQAAPTPLYRLRYDETNNAVQLEETGGSSYVPEDEAADINDLDMLLMGNLRDIPILFEGESGVGKTFISQAFMRTVFPQDSCISLRLSGTAFLNNVFQPFLEGRIENGMPVTRIKASAVDGMAAMLVDEINRGDPQNILQLLDNELYNAGAFVKLGLRIPALDGKAAIQSGGRRKKLTIVSAQNPAVSADAKFTGTIELDAAVDSRLLKITFGNAANSVGSGVWLTEEIHGPFDAFLDSFSSLTAAYLGVDRKQLDSIKTDWLSVYAWVTDSARTDKPILYSALELTDALVAILGGDLPGKLAYEARIANQWSSRLGLKVKIPEDGKETEQVKKAHEIIATFKVPMIFRDIVQIKKLGDVLSTLLSLRQGLRAEDPVRTYIGMDRFVSIREIAGAAALLARSKQHPGAAPATPLINETLLQYVSLTESYLAEIGYMPARFRRTDPNVGIKKLAIVSALRDALKKSRGASFLIAQLGDETARIAKSAQKSDVVRSVLAAKLAADLLTLAGFVADGAAEVDEILKKCRGANRDQEALTALTAFYYARRDNHAPVMGDIFQHRMARTLGG
ncbi:MAG: hypothetical protein AB1714_11955 [Acidobacteriota bacterium]